MTRTQEIILTIIFGIIGSIGGVMVGYYTAKLRALKKRHAELKRQEELENQEDLERIEYAKSVVNEVRARLESYQRDVKMYKDSLN
jgi:hypothetical protein